MTQRTATVIAPYSNTPESPLDEQHPLIEHDNHITNTAIESNRNEMVNWIHKSEWRERGFYSGETFFCCWSKSLTGIFWGAVWAIFFHTLLLIHAATCLNWVQVVALWAMPIWNVIPLRLEARYLQMSVVTLLISLNALGSAEHWGGGGFQPWRCERPPRLQHTPLAPNVEI